MIRVGVVDDHPVVLDGLAAALSRQPSIEVAWSVGTASAAREAIERDACDVVLVDVRLPDGSGLDLIRAGEQPAFLVLSSFDRPQYARAAFEKGARGYLLKTAPLDEVVAAIQVAAGSGTVFAADHLSTIAGDGLLTPRELEIVRLVAQGWSNDEVAARLTLSRKTVEAYLTRLFERWGVNTRTELAIRAERDGWLEETARGGGLSAGPS